MKQLNKLILVLFCGMMILVLFFKIDKEFDNSNFFQIGVVMLTGITLISWGIAGYKNKQKETNGKNKQNEPSSKDNKLK